MRTMTTLSNNIRRMRKLYGFTQDTLGFECGISGAAVSQWEAAGNPTMPDLNHLLTMAGLFKVTIEQLVYADGVEPNETLSTYINNNTLEKVFLLLAQNPTIDSALTQAHIKRKTYLFGLLYSLCEDMETSQLASTTGLMEMIGLSTGVTNKNEFKTKKPSRVTKKHNKRNH